jgi:hypothetical protein
MLLALQFTRSGQLTYQEVIIMHVKTKEVDFAFTQTLLS